MRFGSRAGTLVVDPSAVFTGTVAANSGVNDVLDLAGTAPGTLSGLGTQFTGFSTLDFSAGSAWTVDSTLAALDGGQSITGFASGDAIVLQNFTATSETYVAGTGLELGNANSTVTLALRGDYTGEAFAATTANGNTTVEVGTLISTISTAITTSVTVGSGFYASTLTVTGTGSVIPTAHGATALTLPGAAAVLLNQGTLTGGNGGASLFGAGGTGGAGVSLAGGSLTNTDRISGGAGGASPNSPGGQGGSGADLSGGTLVNAGTISGGGGGAGHSGNGASGDAVQFGSATGATLVIDPGAVFNGAVAANTAVDDGLVLAGTIAATLTGLGSQFTGFSTIVFDAGSDWTLAGTATGFGGATIDGFGPGETIDLQGIGLATAATLGAGNTLTITGGTGGPVTLDLDPSHNDASDLFETVSDGSGGTDLTVLTDRPPTISGVRASEAVYDNATITPFAGVTIGATTPSEIVSVEITLSSTANGSLSNLGAGSYARGVYTVTGTAAQDTAAIDGLVFTPVEHEVAPGSTVITTFTVAATDGILASTGNPTTTLTTTATAQPISAATPTEYVALVGATSAHPFSNITITDPNGVSETAVVSLSNTARGTLADPNAATDHSVSSDGTITITGSAASVAADLDGLVFTPAANSSAISTAVTAAITDSDQAATSITSTVLATTPTTAASGAAGSPAIVTAAAAGSPSDTAIAQGGSGGAGKIGGAGGAATASASATNASGPAFAAATSTGGTGGASTTAGGAVGAAGVASNTAAFASGTTAATASVTQTGGTGGSGTHGVAATSGAPSLLLNAVSGVTNGGTLSLSQIAIGGNGGASDTSFGGDGGVAGSSLIFNDKQNATQSAAINALVEATGGNAGTGSLYTPYGNTGAVNANITGTGNVTVTGVAKGGIGASGAAGVGNGGAASAAVTATAAGTATATATSTGGLGGSSSKGSGMGGGTATATTATASGAVAIAQATGVGGQGGAGSGGGQAGRGGAVAQSVTASATGVSSATASATTIGGAGGAGTGGAAGGAGGAANFVNAVTGSTAGGSLTLAETAIGGAGGNSDTGAAGSGGLALAQLTFNDATSAAITATVTGTGGNGGSSAGAAGGGGASWETAVITGTGQVTVTSTATGGNAGTGGGGAAGGAAQAKATGTGSNVNVTSTADGGAGLTVAGVANAVATGTGASGTVTAGTHTSLAGAGLITSVSGTAMGVVDGTATVMSQAGIASTEPWTVGDAAIAYIDAAPGSTIVTPIMSNDPHTAAALGSGADELAVGQLGGGHSSVGATTQTTTASTDITLNLAQLSGSPDLLLALDGPVSAGTGVTGVTLTVTADGASVLSESFTSAAAADSFFTDHPIDLGSLSSGALAASPALDLTVATSVTSTQPGASIETQFLLGADMLTPSGGMNFIYGGGGDEMFVLPVAGKGVDYVNGFSLSNGDVLDLANALTAAGWTGNNATLGNYLRVSESGGNAIIDIVPGGSGAGVTVAQLNGVSNLTLPILQPHAVL